MVQDDSKRASEMPAKAGGPGLKTLGHEKAMTFSLDKFLKADFATVLAGAKLPT